MSTQIIRPPTFQKPNGYIFSSVTQNVNNLAWTKVAFDSIAPNFVDGIEDLANERILPGVAGFYYVSGNVQIKDTDVVPDSSFYTSIYVSGVPGLRTMKHSSLADFLHVGISNVIYLTNTDFVEVYFQQCTGMSILISSAIGTKADTFLTIQRVR